MTKQEGTKMRNIKLLCATQYETIPGESFLAPGGYNFQGKTAGERNLQGKNRHTTEMTFQHIESKQGSRQCCPLLY